MTSLPAGRPGWSDIAGHLIPDVLRAPRPPVPPAFPSHLPRPGPGPLPPLQGQYTIYAYTCESIHQILHKLFIVYRTHMFDVFFILVFF